VILVDQQEYGLKTSQPAAVTGMNEEQTFTLMAHVGDQDS